MVQSLEGNVLRPPGFGKPTEVDSAEELLAATGAGLLKKGGHVAKGIGVLRSGELMKFDSANNTWVKATTADVEALNYKPVDATDEDRLINVILGGTVKASVGALKDQSDKKALATALGGRYTPGLDYINF